MYRTQNKSVATLRKTLLTKYHQILCHIKHIKEIFALNSKN